MYEYVIGSYCVVRGDRSGVFAGVVQNVDGQTVQMEDVRRLWYWSGAASISQIAKDGVKFPHDCKFTVVVDHLLLTDAIEIIPATEEAEECISEVPEWRI